MKKIYFKVIAFLFVTLIAFSSLFFVTSAVVGEAAGKNAALKSVSSLSGAKSDFENEKKVSDLPVLTVTSESLSVVRGKTVQMNASVNGVKNQPAFIWTSSDIKIASVNQSGKVRGISAGRAIITATAIVNGKKLSGSFAINVVTKPNLIKDLLERKQILSYQYSYIDDYYYTNDKDCWQHNFGFGKVYDLVAPYVLLEYDYTRVFFTY